MRPRTSLMRDQNSKLKSMGIKLCRRHSENKETSALNSLKYCSCNALNNNSNLIRRKQKKEIINACLDRLDNCWELRVSFV